MNKHRSDRYGYRVHHIKRDGLGGYESCEIGHADGCGNSLIVCHVGQTPLVLEPTGNYDLSNYLRSLSERDKEYEIDKRDLVEFGSPSESFNYERRVIHE